MGCNNAAGLVVSFPYLDCHEGRELVYLSHRGPAATRLAEGFEDYNLMRYTLAATSQLQQSQEQQQQQHEQLLQLQFLQQQQQRQWQHSALAISIDMLTTCALGVLG